MKLHNLQQIYELAAYKMLHEPLYWKSFLQYAGKMYGYDFTTLASMYVQNAEYTQMATYEAWNKLNLKIRPREKSIPALMQNHFGMSHMFDVSQLTTEPKVKNWFVGDKEQERFDKLFREKNQNYLKPVICETSTDIIGSMILEQMNNINKENSTIGNVLIENGESIFNNVLYLVKQRCNIPGKEESATLSNLNLEEFTYYGRFVMNISRPILLNCKSVVNEMRKEHRNEQGTAREDRNELYREGQSPIRRRERRAGREVHKESRQVRADGTAVLEGKQGSTAGDSSSQRNNDEDDASNRGTSKSENDTVAEGIVEEGANQESKEHNGKLQTQTKNSRHGRGNRTSGDSVQIELDLEHMELQIEVDSDAAEKREEAVGKIREVISEVMSNQTIEEMEM